MKHLCLIGAAGYPFLELLYRGRTHYSMAIAGGASASLIGKIGQMNIPKPAKPMLCAAGITGIEALCGVIWNRDYGVWDYRRVPMNWKGQICLPYTLMWYGLSSAILSLLDTEKH